MSIRVMSLIWDSDIASPEKMVLLALADYGNDDGVSIYPTIDTLATKCSKDRSTIMRILDRLEEHKYIEVERKHRTHNQYCINLDKIRARVAKCDSAGSQNETQLGRKMQPQPLIKPKTINHEVVVEDKQEQEQTPYNLMVAMVERIMGDDIVVHTQKDRDYIKEFIRVGVTAQDVVGAMTWRASERMPKAGSVAQLGRGILTAQRLRLKDEASKKKYLEFDKDKYINGKFQEYIQH